MIKSDNIRKKFLSSALLLSGSLLFGLLLIEAVLRISGFSYRLTIEKVQFGWPTPQAIKRLYLPDKELFWVPKYYYKSLQLLRSQHPTLVFMGDSCTQFGRYDEYFSSLISTKFPNNNITYVNFGVGGWSSYQGLQQLKRDILNLKPKIITIYYGWNDHWMPFGIEDKDIGRINSSLCFQLQNCRLGQLVTKLLVTFWHKKSAPQRVTPADFRRNILEMVKLARENNIIPVLLTAPTSAQRGKEPPYLRERWLKNTEDLIPWHRQYTSIIREIAQEKHVVLCDLAEKFDSLPRQQVISEYFTEDVVHLTELGNKKLAEFLYDCFKQNNLLQQMVN